VTSDVSIETVARRREKKDDDGGKTLPFQRGAAPNAFAIINGQRDENGNHRNPDERDLVGGSHWERLAQASGEREFISPIRRQDGDMAANRICFSIARRAVDPP
jgi:hypothetical protein